MYKPVCEHVGETEKFMILQGMHIEKIRNVDVLHTKWIRRSVVRCTARRIIVNFDALNLADRKKVKKK